MLKKKQFSDRDGFNFLVAWFILGCSLIYLSTVEYDKQPNLSPFYFLGFIGYFLIFSSPFIKNNRKYFHLLVKQKLKNGWIALWFPLKAPWI